MGGRRDRDGMEPAGWASDDPHAETRRARQQTRRELARVQRPDDALDVGPLPRPQRTEERPEPPSKVMKSPSEQRSWRLRHWRRPEWKRRSSFKSDQAEQARDFYGDSA